MRFGSSLIPAVLVTGFGLLALPACLLSQATGSASFAIAADSSTADIPDAPQPQIVLVGAATSSQQNPAGQTQSAQPPNPDPTQTQPPATQSNSSSQAPASKTVDEKSQHDQAEEQLKAQEHQRVFGVMASFNTTRNKDALPLSSGQKFRLFFKSATDPWAFGLASVVAGIGQAKGSDPEWGQGLKGYATRYGADYGDYFIGNFFGNAVLPSLLHEDPRYFQKGTGSVAGRIFWAASSTVWCKRDRGGWGPNWSNVMGNLIGTAIGRAYYPASERTVTDTITDGLTVTAEGIVGSEVIEFWPDMVRHYRRKHAEKLARQAANSTGQSPSPPTSQEQSQK
jgi:hypothetical protein